ISGDSKSFKEITQTGLECIGKVTLYDECEVLYLALESLATIDKNFILDLSHAGLVAVLLDSMNLENGVRRKIVEALQAKSADALTSLYEAGEIDRRSLDISNKLLANYKSSKALKSAFKGLGADDELESFVSILAAAEQFDFGGKLNVDFSIVDDRSYYSGVVFKGYIKGVPSEVLSGGRYDTLIGDFGRSVPAVGFAVNVEAAAKVLLKNSDTELRCPPDVLVYAESGAEVDGLRHCAELIRQGSTVYNSVFDSFEAAESYAKSRGISRIVTVVCGGAVTSKEI
ncbi:MAG: ATP phosphoribosyltransferase regulatory subunit, partial [Oscillospiraceae bacterium]|nr:ATP phosphoribosyltransferase regulatory subunit [Oscillospiraceae bacterium]